MIIHNRGLGRTFDPVPQSNVDKTIPIAEQIVQPEESKILDLQPKLDKQRRQEEIKAKRLENLKKAREARAAKKEEE